MKSGTCASTYKAAEGKVLGLSAEKFLEKPNT